MVKEKKNSGHTAKLVQMYAYNFNLIVYLSRCEVNFIA